MEDLHLPLPRTVYRALGTDSGRERIGVGIMDKAGVRLDQSDTDPPTWSLVQVLRGQGRYRDGSGPWQLLQPGACFLRIPGRRQSTELDPDSRWLEAFIDLGWALPRVLTANRMLPEHALVWQWGLLPARVARFTALIGDLSVAGDRELPELCVRCQALVMEALRAQDSVRPGDDPIDRYCRILADEATARLDLRVFCRRERLDYERFRKDFTRRVGQAPGQYRIRRRIERAGALLHSSSDDLATIAAALGYSSAYEFSAQFRQWMGVPPGRYRGTR